jgi:hypothetical protein
MAKDRQVFDSFELIAAPELAQAVAQESAEGESLAVANATGTNATKITEAADETAQGGGNGDGDDNAGDGNGAVQHVIPRIPMIVYHHPLQI